MNPYLIPTIMTIALFACAAVGCLIGFFKGAIKGAVDIGVTAICAFLAVPITKILSNILFSEKVIGFIVSKASTSLPSELGSYGAEIQAFLQGEETSTIVRELIMLLFSLPVVLLLPIVFLIVFATLCLIAHIIALIVESLVCPKTKNIWLKILGAALTGASAALIAITVSVPFIGYANFTVNSIEYFKETTNPDEVQALDSEPSRSEKINNKAYGVMDTILTYIKPVTNNFASKAIYTCGGKGVFNILTTTKVSNVNINLQKEVNGAVDLYDCVMVFVDVSPNDYGKAQTEAVKEINKSLETTELIPLVLSKAISFTASEFQKGNSILGIEKPDLGEEANPTLDRILAVLATTDSNAMRNDLMTISNIAIGAVERGVIDKVTAEEKDIWGIFEDEEVIKILLVELYKNERTRNMIPYLTGAITNYAYKMYNDVNGTDLKPEEFDYGTYDEEHLRQEAIYIANSVREIHNFVDSADFSSEVDSKELILNADVGALGRGLTELRNGMFTQRLFEILLKAILESEAIDELGIVDSKVIAAATKPNSNLEKMLVSRQNVLRLAIAIKDKEEKEKTTELLDSVIGSLLEDDDDSLSTIITGDTLTSLGMAEDEAESIESIVDSLIDGINDMKADKISDEERLAEAEKTHDIISSVADAVLDKDATAMFDPSGEGLTAEQFVSDIMDSKLASNMMKNAIEGENGEIASDPYKIQDKLSDSDKDALSQALNGYQGENADEDTLNAIANIFGVTR